MKKYLISILTILLCISFILPNFVYAGEINTNDYKGIYNSQGTSKVTKAGGSVLAVVQVIGISVGVIMLIIMGIKYMISSIDEKANIKEKLIPYVIGAVIMFGGTGILTIIANFAQNMNK